MTAQVVKQPTLETWRAAQAAKKAADKRSKKHVPFNGIRGLPVKVTK